MFADFIVPFWNGMPISPGKSACGKVSRVRHMVPGGSRESLPKRKVRFADQPPRTRSAAPAPTRLKASLAGPGWDKGSRSRNVYGDYKTLRRLSLPKSWTHAWEHSGLLRTSTGVTIRERLGYQGADGRCGWCSGRRAARRRASLAHIC